MVKKKATKLKAKSKTKIKTKRAAPTRRAKTMSRATSSKNDEKYKAQYTTRHGSHLTKTTVGVSDTEADIKDMYQRTEEMEEEKTTNGII